MRRVAIFAVITVAVSTGPASAISFRPYQAYHTGSWPTAVAIGDVTNDGRNDVLLTTADYFDPDHDNKLFLFRQQANGLLAPAEIFTPIGVAGPPAVGDLTGDGLNDVALGNYSQGVNIFPQQNGTLGAPILIPGTVHASVVVVSDMNHDGLNDIVFSRTEDGIALALNTGVGFTIRAVSPQAQSRVQVADTTGDGLLDIVGLAERVLRVYPQLGDGTFGGPVTYQSTVDLNGFALGDVTGDGCADATVSDGGNRPTSHVAVLAQNASGTFDPPVHYPSYDIPEPVEALDMDGDGRLDVATLHGGWERAGVYLQTQQGTLGPESLFPITYASHYSKEGLALGDFSGDGAPDIAIADYNFGLVVLRQIPEDPPPPPSPPKCPLTNPPPPPPAPAPPPQPPPPPPAPPAVRCRVPRLIGLTPSRARRKIRRAHCSLGRVRQRRSRLVGRVIAQRPAAGRLRPRGTRINLVVGRR